MGNHLRMPRLYTADGDVANAMLLPDWYQMDTLGSRMEFTQSMWKAYGKCQWRYFLNYEERIVRKTKAMPLEFGTLVHEMVQARLAGESFFAVTDMTKSWANRMIEAVDNGEANFRENEIADHAILAEHMLQRWDLASRGFDVLTLPFDHNPYQRKPLIETRGRVPLNDIVDFAFGFDGVVAQGSEIWIWELKTTSISSMDDYARSIEFEPQAWGYVWAAKKLFGRCDGIIYDVLRKRIPPPLKTLKCRRKACDSGCAACGGTGVVGLSKANKDTQLDGWDETMQLLMQSPKGREQIESGETEQIRKGLERASEGYHYRIYKRPSEEHLKAFEEEMTAAASEVARKRRTGGTFLKMRGNCRLWNRDCTYLPICPTDAGDGSRLFHRVSGHGPVELDVKEMK